MTLHKVTQNDTFCTLSRENIIALVQEAIIENPNDNPFDFRLSSIEAVERFAALVAAHEREACAKVCEDIAEEFAYEPLQPDPGYCADAIRARGEAKPYATQAAMVESQTQGRMQMDPATGDVSIGAIRARGGE